MATANPIAAPMIGRSKTHEDPYSPANEDEPEENRTQYQADVGALLDLATNTHPDISFAMSVLARHSHIRARKQWHAVKHLLWYLRGSEDLGLFYNKSSSPELIGYADSGFKTNTVTGKFQTGYIFLKNGAPVSWKSTKQTITPTSTNHVKPYGYEL